MKKVLAIVITLALFLTLSLPAFADSNPTMDATLLVLKTVLASNFGEDNFDIKNHDRLAVSQRQAGDDPRLDNKRLVLCCGNHGSV